MLLSLSNIKTHPWAGYRNTAEREPGRKVNRKSAWEEDTVDGNWDVESDWKQLKLNKK